MIGRIIKRVVTFVTILFLIGMMMKNMSKTQNPNGQESNIVQSKFDLMFKSAKKDEKATTRAQTTVATPPTTSTATPSTTSTATQIMP